MKYTIFTIILSVFAVQANAQATGNVIYNSNNRFNQNTNYKQSSKGIQYKSTQPSVQYDAYGHVQNIASNQGFVLSAFTPATNEVTMNINILYNAKPSSYMAIFHLNQSGKKIVDLDSQVSKKVNKFKALAKSIGIGPENFYTDMIALVPIFEQGKRNSSKPKGFELQKNLHIKYNNPSDLDKLFSFAAQCEIYDLIKVEYMFDDAERIGKEMHAKALLVHQEKLKFYSSMGIKLDTAERTISESGNVYFPIDKYTAYQPLAVSSLEDEDKPAEENNEVMKTKSGMIQRTTVFFNPTDCSGFDAVIQPNNIEPPIQFTYSLQIRYKMTPQVRIIDNSKITKEKTTELLIITPQGDIKEIKK